MRYEKGLRGKFVVDDSQFWADLAVGRADLTTEIML